MSTPSIYINLPVADLVKSIQFYKALGFTQNLQFTDENASAVAIGYLD